MTRTVLVTGAFGHIGRSTVRQLLGAGRRVVAVDLRSRKAERVATSFGRDLEVIWGDISDPDMWPAALSGVDAVVHMAAIIPPTTERNPRLAVAVNETATIELVKHMEASSTAKRLIFASSMVVAGDEQHRRDPPLRTDEDAHPSDIYGKTKVACERCIRDSGLQWSILRIAACPPMTLSLKDFGNLEAVFETSAKGRIEFVHVDDAALAFANAVDSDPAIGKTLFIGGGERCQSDALDFYNQVFIAMGLLPLKARTLRPGPLRCFGDWLDTSESQELLRFQRHSLESLVIDVRRRVGYKRILVKVCAPLARPFLQWRSPYPEGSRGSQGGTSAR